MKIKFDSTFFLKSVSDISQLDIFNGIEVAFVGATNSGKSTTINCIANKRKISRTSKIPGRTQLINFFEVTNNFRLVDLPGYGFSKVSKLIKRKIEILIFNYLNSRKCLIGLVLIMDIRNPLKSSDLKMILFAIKKNIKILILLNKSDKVSISFQKKQCLIIKNYIFSISKFIKIYIFSSLKKNGIDNLKKELEKWNK
ncbi:ribosome biogenesis GTP-binding protein YihA/YsxC [Buchnera aphidicola (Mindarus keteleerifoliae)]|uniref:ribosome biogenesis GTP-binding protein YihA/YsxC n=1 Tax=Buchnera aphidicola TaxID=9 RepID=UPI0031B71FE1